jgi:hypothetical protein
MAFAAEWMAPTVSPERFANHLAFWCMDLADPQLHEHALAVHQAQGAIETLLAEAVSKGELRAGTDTAALAGSVQAITAGAGLTWALDRHGALPQRLQREISSLLDLHGPSGDSSAHWADALEQEYGPL